MIVKHFSQNPKTHPFTITLSSLFSYFQKIMIYHTLEKKNKQYVASMLGIHPFFIQEYEIASKNYSINKLLDIFSFLREYDIKSKGIQNRSTENSELLKELSYKILQ